MEQTGIHPMALNGGESRLLSPEGKGIRDLLRLGRPQEPHVTPPIFTFNRKREVPISWLEMAGESSRSSLGAMKTFFENSWELPAQFDQPELNRVITTDGFIGDLNQEQKEPSYRFNPTPLHRTVFPTQPEDPIKSEPVDKGLVFKDGCSGRLYRAIPLRDDKPPQIEGFTKMNSYLDEWEKIGGFELLFATPDDASVYFTNFTELDLRPAFIERRWKELDILWEMAKNIDDAVPKLSRETLTQLLASGAELGDIEQTYQKFMRLRMSCFDLEVELQKLVSFAADLGYFLYLDGKKFPLEGGKVDAVDKGKVYTKVKNTVRWTTIEQRPVVEHYRGFLGIRRTRRRMVKYEQQHSQVMQVHQRVDTSSDLLARWRDEYRKTYPDAEVMVFDRAADGFVTNEGVRLGTIMDRCKLDEDFRRRCAVILPIYEVSLSGKRVVIKYHVFERPMSAIVPTALPHLSIEESLSYRTAWQGIELGELTSSINLAPGERRTVSISKQFEQETVVSKATNSVFELEEKESSDLTSEMETEFNKEQQVSTTASLSASISGGNVFVTAQASASAGVDTSNAEFAKTINKVARKASSSASRKNRQEVSTSETSRTTVTTTDTMTAEVQNINEGRTLNLMFYRLYNRYQGGLYLDGLQFDVIPGVELIAGSGVYESRKFGFGELARVVRELAATPLPFEIDSKGESHLAQLVVDQVGSLVKEEYAEPEPSANRTGERSTPSRSVKVLTLPPPRPEDRSRANAAAADENTLEELQERLKTAITTLQTGKAVEEVPLRVATQGLYIDALVGEQPSTEPYSEHMRDMEISMRAAEVFATESEGILQRAQASRIAYLLSGTNGGLMLTTLGYDRKSLQRLTLGLNGPLPNASSDWKLLVDKKSIAGQWTDSDEPEVTICFDSEQDWLTDDDLIFKLELYHPASATSVAFPVLRGMSNGRAPASN